MNGLYANFRLKGTGNHLIESVRENKSREEREQEIEEETEKRKLANEKWARDPNNT